MIGARPIVHAAGLLLGAVNCTGTIGALAQDDRTAAAAKNVPWLLAGGASYFKMGRSLQFKSLPHNNLLVSVCNAMGFADVTTFGIPGVCTGAFPGLV